MEKTPKSLRIQIAVCGRINVGKSTLFNLIAGQNAAITSPERGTTTDVVEKTMELRPLGPIVLLDTAGSDDDSVLGEKRIRKTAAAIDRADAMLLVISPDGFGDAEKALADQAAARNIPVIPVVNIRKDPMSEDLKTKIAEFFTVPPVEICAADTSQRDILLDKLTSVLTDMLPESRISMPFLRDLISENSLVLLMTPVDSQAPKGRLILPEVQAIRDALDGNAAAVIAKENAFPEIFGKLAEKPSLVVCDSQAVHKMTALTPQEIPQTTFSILMSRLKGDINEFAAGCAAIEKLRKGDKVLIAEACTHHAAENDIGKVQIPELLEKKAGGKLDIHFYSGADYPEDLASFKIIIHCGGCMLNRRAMLNRIRMAINANVPICNYGMCISACRGVIEKVLSPFPNACKKYLDSLEKHA